MNTQQVSPVCTVNASAAWWENTLRNDGFVKNINATNEHDVIAAKVVIERMSQRANRSCGLYYEMYERTFLGMALDYVEQLPLSHRPVFSMLLLRRVSFCHLMSSVTVHLPVTS